MASRARLLLRSDAFHRHPRGARHASRPRSLAPESARAARAYALLRVAPRLRERHVILQLGRERSEQLHAGDGEDLAHQREHEVGHSSATRPGPPAGPRSITFGRIASAMPNVRTCGRSWRGSALRLVKLTLPGVEERPLQRLGRADVGARPRRSTRAHADAAARDVSPRDIGRDLSLLHQVVDDRGCEDGQHRTVLPVRSSPSTRRAVRELDREQAGQWRARSGAARRR